MRPYHTYAMGHTALASLQAAFGCSSSSNCSAVEVLENWENPRLRRPAAISDARLASLAAELNLVSVAATPFAVQWVTNTLANGDVRAPPHHTGYPHPLASRSRASLSNDTCSSERRVAGA